MSKKKKPDPTLKLHWVQNISQRVDELNRQGQAYLDSLPELKLSDNELCWKIYYLCLKIFKEKYAEDWDKAPEELTDICEGSLVAFLPHGGRRGGSLMSSLTYAIIAASANIRNIWEHYKNGAERIKLNWHAEEKYRQNIYEDSARKDANVAD